MQPEGSARCADCDRRAFRIGSQGEAAMTPELLAVLRHRVVTRFYDGPHAVDALARAMIASQDVNL